MGRRIEYDFFIVTSFGDTSLKQGVQLGKTSLQNPLSRNSLPGQLFRPARSGYANKVEIINLRAIPPLLIPHAVGHKHMDALTAAYLVGSIGRLVKKMDVYCSRYRVSRNRTIRQIIANRFHNSTDDVSIEG
ncbi:hypothetical protein SDC9_120362 [bioreactor metagenome]|uniref:Uncharacterized protein n=1 Tax=bioreactor metagenome TaxID=1076179 RepID=A0A645C6S3_9ZZZZ